MPKELMVRGSAVIDKSMGGDLADAWGEGVHKIRGLAGEEIASELVMRYNAYESHTAELSTLRAERDKMETAIRGLLEIGKRDLSNPKYDGYFESLREALAPRGPEGEG